MAGSPDPHLLIRTTYYRDDDLDSEPGENSGIPQGECSKQKIKLTPPMREYCQNQLAYSMKKLKALWPKIEPLCDMFENISSLEELLILQKDLGKLWTKWEPESDICITLLKRIAESEVTPKAAPEYKWILKHGTKFTSVFHSVCLRINTEKLKQTSRRAPSVKSSHSSHSLRSSLSYGSSMSSRARRTQDTLIAAAAAEVNLEYARKEEELRREKADRDLRLQTLEKERQAKEAAAIAAALTDNLSNLGSDHDLSRLGKQPPRDRIKVYLDSIQLENKSPQAQTDVPKRPLVYPNGAQSEHPGDTHALDQIKDVCTEVQRQWAAHQQHSEVQEKLIAEQEKPLQALEKELQVPGEVLTTVQTEPEMTETTAMTTGIDLLRKVKVATTSGAPSFQAPNPLNPTPHEVNKSSPIATEIKRESFQLNENAPDFVYEVPQQDLASYLTQANTHGISYPPYAHQWSWTLTNFQDLANRGVEKFSDEVGGEYILWKRAFQKAVQNLNLQPDEELFLMVRWLGPTSAKEDTDKLWELATLLQKVDLFKNKKFAKGLDHLDDPEMMISVALKLLQHLYTKWKKEVITYGRDHENQHPPFGEFVKFVNFEAEGCISVYGRFYDRHITSFTSKPNKKDLRSNIKSKPQERRMRKRRWQQLPPP
ncbi:UNVERIFIED_CONTAM: hypothetical protein K2H54_052622 [Gekko kuhli]